MILYYAVEPFQRDLLALTTAASCMSVIAAHGFDLTNH